MKIIKTASGKKLKMSKTDWEKIGNQNGWIKTAATQIPAGNFSINIVQQNDARAVGSSVVNGLTFQFKGEQWSVDRNGWAEMESMLQDIEQSFANEIQQASGTV